MIGKYLNLEAASLVAVFIPRGSEEESLELYKEISEAVTNVVYPKVVGHLEGSQVVKTVHACQTIEELEKLHFDTVYPAMFAELGEELNKEKRINDSERIFILTRVADQVLYAAHQWMGDVVRQRAQLIARGETRKIVTLDGLEPRHSKKSKIIT